MNVQFESYVIAKTRQQKVLMDDLNREQFKKKLDKRDLRERFFIKLGQTIR